VSARYTVVINGSCRAVTTTFKAALAGARRFVRESKAGDCWSVSIWSGCALHAEAVVRGNRLHKYERHNPPVRR
jgi:hypothetical protein